MRRFLACLLLTVVGCALGAQASVPHVLVAGTPAKAGDVNENFAALVTAINGLSARVGSLEGAPLSVAGVAGTYSFQQLEIQTTLTPGTGGSGNRAGDYDVAELRNSTFTATLHLIVDGTFTLAGPTQEMALGWVGGYTSQAGTQLTSSAVTLNAPFGTSTGGGSGTWSLSANGLTLVPIAPTKAGNIVFIASGSRLFVSTTSVPGDSHLIILIRTN